MAGLEAALATAPPPTAVLCFNDAVALGAMLALRKRGLEPGADFAVVGFDDIVEAEHYVPPLTSVTRTRRASANAPRRPAGDDPVAHDARQMTISARSTWSSAKAAARDRTPRRSAETAR